MQKWIQNEQNGTQMIPKWSSNARGLQMGQEASRWLKRCQDGLNDAPRAPWGRPRWFQDVPRWLKWAPTWPQEGPRWTQRDPRWPQDGLKMAPRGFKSGQIGSPNGIWYVLKGVDFSWFSSMKMTYWGLEMAPFFNPCDINDMTWCHLRSHACTCESKLASMMHYKRTWCALRGLKDAPRVPKRPCSILPPSQNGSRTPLPESVTYSNWYMK